VFVSYEELCQRREEVLHETLARLGLPAFSGARGGLDQESFSTSQGRQGASLEERVLGWRRRLSPQQIEQIGEIARRFGLGDRLFDGAAGREAGAEPTAALPAPR
jgi:hypothetical protein